MKKILALVLAFMLVVSLVGCGSSKDTAANDTKKESTASDVKEDKAPATEETDKIESETVEVTLTKEELHELHEEAMKKFDFVKKSDFVKKHDDSVIADGLNKGNCLSEKAVTEGGKDDIPEYIKSSYPDAKKCSRYAIGTTKDGTEYLSLDVITDSNDNILYMSYQLMSAVWDNNEDIRNYYMAQCGQVLAAFIGCSYEEGYNKVIEAYNSAAQGGGEESFGYWNDHRYFMSISGEGGYIGFIIQAPFVE